ncbi:hypothetical protein WA1_02805 [Scytonema hofmannii PCC 7110]|uniref:Uncharacterized protein n=1 Tax=Scytonema hofmannii PCC 7110 TaxID=128403 RepID=A0A139XHC2_9CYAN|nr:hypothetical protein [Scytonema hofmannii]KYC44088.1 hypothetical protein WA1_02805 [Scytonema hofmannii PCC 7110]
MSRIYSDLCQEDTQFLLETLADKSIEPEKYREAMKKIGMALGNTTLSQIDNNQANVYLACTVEDADFLAKGILSILEKHLSNIAFACFWNQRLSPFELEDLKVAPIFKKYQEPCPKKVKYLMVVKSIISGACVVRTNLINLIQKIEPEIIFIVAPVMYQNAEQKLKDEFKESISEKFRFFYFAKDDERTAKGEVIPGIGGNVYLRLGFGGQEQKNEYIPEIVKLRRSQFRHQPVTSPASKMTST